MTQKGELPDSKLRLTLKMQIIIPVKNFSMKAATDTYFLYILKLCHSFILRKLSKKINSLCLLITPV